ncbi:hypothetical protein E2C01_007422 [Portunus trituberculatus]|uniref:Uncharacterized protein n=1 Tax=Portunus trituberculatus TaxID=210409 RepID=A0A5B7D0G4_PORTR|nr:hypothetical protein [Portunus trituberculatus]
MLQHLRGFCKPLHCSGLLRVKLGRRDLHAFIQGLRKHGCTYTLGPGLIQLLIHVINLVKISSVHRSRLAAPSTWPSLTTRKAE